MVHLALLALAIGTVVGTVAIFAMLVAGGARMRPLPDGPADASGPRVSVVVAARDEGPNIERALQSLLAQRYDSLEVIAIDDRSTDDTGAVLDRMALADRRLHVVRITELPPGWLGKNHALHTGAG